MRGSAYIFLVGIVMVLMVLSGCTSDRKANAVMDRAEALMEQYPDSALSLLESVDTNRLLSKSDKARYGLMMAMARDKNLIDDTTFVTLQPAIDYFIDKGTPDERMRTLYYQGRIFQNRGEYTPAMEKFVAASDNENITDSACYARALVSQGNLNHLLYNLEAAIALNKKAAKIYSSLNSKDKEYLCWCRILGNSIMADNKTEAVNAFHQAQNILDGNPNVDPEILDSFKILYASYIVSDDTLLRNELSEKITLVDSTTNTETLLNMSIGYERLGEYHNAYKLLSLIDWSGVWQEDPQKAYGTMATVSDALGYKDISAHAYKKYAEASDSINTIIYNSRLQFAEERHAIEMRVEKERSKKTSARLVAALISLGALLVAIISFYAVYTGKLKRKILEAQIKDMELLAESRVLKIRDRLGIMKSMFVAHAANDKKKKREFDIWKKELESNADLFMKTNFDFLSLTHPNFIDKLSKTSLDEKERMIVGLYAIGLTGKEIGNLLQKKSFYNMALDIRKKLLESLSDEKSDDTDKKISLSTIVKRLMEE